MTQKSRAVCLKLTARPGGKQHMTFYTQAKQYITFCAQAEEYNTFYTQEATRVLVEDKEKISSIGKHIRIWNGIDCGVFRFTSEIYEVMNQWINCDISGRYELGDMLAYFIDQGGLLKSCDISGQFWSDIDNPEDLQRLQAWFVQPDE